MLWVTQHRAVVWRGHEKNLAKVTRQAGHESRTALRERAGDDAAATVTEYVEFEFPPRRHALERLEKVARVFLWAARYGLLVKGDHASPVVRCECAHRRLGNLREHALRSAENPMDDEQRAVAV